MSDDFEGGPPDVSFGSTDSAPDGSSGSDSDGSSGSLDSASDGQLTPDPTDEGAAVGLPDTSATGQSEALKQATSSQVNSATSAAMLSFFIGMLPDQQSSTPRGSVAGTSDGGLASYTGDPAVGPTNPFEPRGPKDTSRWLASNNEQQQLWASGIDLPPQLAPQQPLPQPQYPPSPFDHSDASSESTGPKLGQSSPDASLLTLNPRLATQQQSYENFIASASGAGAAATLNPPDTSAAPAAPPDFLTTWFGDLTHTEWAFPADPRLIQPITHYDSGNRALNLLLNKGLLPLRNLLASFDNVPTEIFWGYRRSIASSSSRRRLAWIIQILQDMLPFESAMGLTTEIGPALDYAANRLSTNFGAWATARSSPVWWFTGAGGVGGSSLGPELERSLPSLSTSTSVPPQAVNPRLTARLAAWSEYRGQLSFPEWVNRTQGAPWGTGFPSGYARWFESATSPNGNSALSQRLAYLYARYDQSGQFLKWGITQDLAGRYTGAELLGQELIMATSGPRSEMLQLERELAETIPGPLNFESWAGERFGDDL
jgi:hypothetical protein